MTHGFDDEGRQFDAEGNLSDWWTPDDARSFTRAREASSSSSSTRYVALDTLHVNGKLTLGENIADFGGVSLAYDALQRALKRKAAQPIDGFTPEQRFFLGYAQAGARASGPSRRALLLATDPHSPGAFRVNGPLSNMPEFAKAFGCKEGDPMVRTRARARIW